MNLNTNDVTSECCKEPSAAESLHHSIPKDDMGLKKIIFRRIHKTACKRFSLSGMSPTPIIPEARANRRMSLPGDSQQSKVSDFVVGSRNYKNTASGSSGSSYAYSKIPFCSLRNHQCATSLENMLDFTDRRCSVNRRSSLRSSISTTSSINSKTVMFDSVQVREYEPSISLNPTVEDGMAVELGWNYIIRSDVTVEEFESNRPAPVASNKELLLDSVVRLKMLRAGGYSTEEIQKAVDTTKKAHKDRMKTVKKLQKEDVRLKQKWL